MADDGEDAKLSPDDASGDEQIVSEAKRRFKRCREWESEARSNALEDKRFAEGDSRNGWQWDEGQRQSRAKTGRPALTINKVRQGCLQIINDQRQNKSQIRVRPVGDGASFEAAEVYEGVIRHVEYQSNAMETYDSAAWHQITGGYGAWRVTTEYADDGSLDQDAFIRRIKDPNSVYLDPDIEEFDGSDARFGFVYKDLARDRFKSEHPDWAAKIPDGTGALMDEDAGWHDKDHVRVAEYFRRTETSDVLHHVDVPDGAPWPLGVPRAGVVRQSDHPKEHHRALAAMATRSRNVTKASIEWFKIAGDQVIERGTFPGRYIPLVRVIGEETVIAGKLDRKGHVRALLDPQRTMNYYASQAVEFVAGQTKTPWIVTAEAIEGNETYWNDANTVTRPYLVYNGYDEQGRATKPPERIAPPVAHQSATEGMDRAERWMMAASGQYQAQFGESENAKSGVAINARQRQGDNATYHYIDHMAQAQRLTGRILIGIIPEIYDTPRVIKIMAEDGEQSDVQVLPGAGQAHSQVAPGPNGQPALITPEQAAAAQADKALAAKVQTIFDPKVGRYDVEADVGPSYGTKRQEAFNALQQIMSQNQEAMKIGGDLMFKAADFPMADELAERFRRTVPPDVLGAGPPPAVRQAQQQVKTLQGHLADLLKQLHDKGQQESRADAEEKRKDYEAETARMVALAKIYPNEFKPAVRQLMSDVMNTPIVPLMAAHNLADQAFGTGDAPPAPGAAPSPATEQGGAPVPADPAQGLAAPPPRPQVTPTPSPAGDPQLPPGVPPAGPRPGA